MANPLPQEVKDYPSFCDSLEIIEDKCLLVCEAIATFWQELINQHSSLNKLEYLLGQVAEARTVIVAAVTNALEIFPNHPRILTVYGGLM